MPEGPKGARRPESRANQSSGRQTRRVFSETKIMRGERI